MKFERRKGALERLQQQLSDGVKTASKKRGGGIQPLTETDRYRIQREISTLNDRI